MKYSRNFYQIKSNQEIFDRLVAEKDSIGYYNLPYKDISNITAYTESIKQKYIVVLGIGGSSLGARAIYEFLLPSKTFDKELIFLETIDPLKVNFCINKIDLNNTHFVVVSKSGNTIETLSLMKYIDSRNNLNESNCTVISEIDSNLSNYAKDNQIKLFPLDKNIGGRFSAFSVAGLVPLAMAGVDIENLLNGCRRVSDSFFNMSGYYDEIIQKARFLVENKSRFNINAIFSYSSSLESFNKWYIQLWAESLGKININGTRQGLTPIALIGPVDQHSFLQLIMDGVRDKTLTFIKINNLKDNTVIPNQTNKFESLNMDFIDGLELNDLLIKQADATIESIENQKDIPCDVITIRTVDEYNIAKLMFTYQLLVSTIGAFLQINTYDQPGVEDGKSILINRLKDSHGQN